MIDITSLHLPAALALAVVATLGYLVGRRRRVRVRDVEYEQAHRELRRARAVAKQLDAVASQIRNDLAEHQSSVAGFKRRMEALSNSNQKAAWKMLCSEAEGLLGPTQRLVTQIAHAYDELRQQINQLMTFAEIRTDPLTGVGNRRAFNESLQTNRALCQRYGNVFSIAMFDIDRFKQINDLQGHLMGDCVLQAVADILLDAARQTDRVIRYGGEEFVIVMPHTDLAGAAIFAERLRADVATSSLLPTSITVSGGVACIVQSDEDDHAIVSRADRALYHAKQSGRDCVFLHDGDAITPVTESVIAPTA